MKISIEFKDGKYTVTYGKIVGVGGSINEALDAMTKQFRLDLEKFFIAK